MRNEVATLSAPHLFQFLDYEALVRMAHRFS
jgi:hypothetical protein